MSTRYDGLTDLLISGAASDDAAASRESRAELYEKWLTSTNLEPYVPPAPGPNRHAEHYQEWLISGATAYDF